MKQNWKRITTGISELSSSRAKSLVPELEVREVNPPKENREILWVLGEGS